MKNFLKDLIYFFSSLFSTIIGWSITVLTITYLPIISLLIRVSSGVFLAVGIKHLLEYKIENKDFKIKNANQFSKRYKNFIFWDFILLTIGWFVSIIFLFLVGPVISFIIRLIYGITTGAILFKHGMIPGNVNRSSRNRLFVV